MEENITHHAAPKEVEYRSFEEWHQLVEKFESVISYLLDNYDGQPDSLESIILLQNKKTTILEKNLWVDTVYNRDIKYLLENLTKIFGAKTDDELDHALLAYPNKLYDVLSRLFHEYLNIIYHLDEMHIPIEKVEDPIYKKMREDSGVSLDYFLRYVSENASLNLKPFFFKRYPFALTLVELHVLRESRIYDLDNYTRRHFSIYIQLQKFILQTEIIKPLSFIIDTIQSAIIACEKLDTRELRKFLHWLSNHIKKYISYAKREEKPFDSVNWRAIEILGHMCLVNDYANLFENNIQLIKQDLQNLQMIFSQIRSAQISLSQEQETKPFNCNLGITLIEDFADYYSDIETLKHICKCLESLQSVTEDTKVNRFAILRALTIIGEGLKNLSPAIKHPLSVISELKTIRNQIIHPRGPTPVSVLKQLINDLNDQRLLKLASCDFPELLTYFRVLLEERKKYLNKAEFVGNFKFNHQMNLIGLKGLIAPLTKSYRLSLVEREELIATLPKEDERRTTEKRQALKNVLLGMVPLPKNKDDFTNLFAGIGIKDKELGRYYVKLDTCKKFSRVIEQLTAYSLSTIKIQIRDQSELVTIENNTGRIYLSNKLMSIINNSFKKKVAQDFVNSINMSNNRLEVIEIFKLMSDQLSMPQQEAEEILKIVPEDVIDLKLLKDRLIKILHQEDTPVDEPSLNNILTQLGCASSENKLKWWQAFRKLSNAESNHADINSSQKKAKKLFQLDDAFKHVLKNIDLIIAKIASIDELTKDCREESNQFDGFEKFCANKPLIYACELLFGQFVHSIDKLLEYLDKVKDFSDVRLRIGMKHPIDEMIEELRYLKSYRNKLFHLDSVYETFLYLSEEVWLNNFYFNHLKDIGEGKVYPQGITISPEGVTRGPLRSYSLKERLTHVKEEVIRYRDKIFMLRIKKTLTQFDYSSPIFGSEDLGVTANISVKIFNWLDSKTLHTIIPQVSKAWYNLYKNNYNPDVIKDLDEELERNAVNNSTTMANTNTNLPEKMSTSLPVDSSLNAYSASFFSLKRVAKQQKSSTFPASHLELDSLIAQLQNNLTDYRLVQDADVNLISLIETEIEVINQKDDPKRWLEVYIKFLKDELKDKNILNQ